MKYNLLLLIILFSIHSIAQEKKKKIHYNSLSFDQFITETEALFDVKFSYNTSSLSHITIHIDDSYLSLKEIISIVSKKNHVTFKNIDNRYYVIQLNNQIDVCGYLINTDNIPIEGATISNLTKENGSISNTNGYFTLKKNHPSDTLTISYLGYKTLTIPIKKILKQKCNTYKLLIEDFILNEVVIKEYLSSGVLKTRDGSVKIQPNNLRAISGLSEPDILQNIQQLPGIESPLETASGIYIRGGTPDQNLILWDGIKMYNSDHFFGSISAFNPYIINNITIYKSGTQPMFGDRISGVIDIKTNKKIPNKVKGGLGINMTHIDGNLKLPISRKIGIFVSTRRSITDMIKTPPITNYSERAFQNTSITDNRMNFDPEFTKNKELFYFTDATFKLIANISKKDTLLFSNILTKNKLDYSFEDTEFIDTSRDQLEIENFGSNITWKRKHSQNFSTETQISYSQYDLKYKGTTIYSDSNQTIAKNNSIKEYNISFHTLFDINSHFRLYNGYQAHLSEVSFLIEDDDFKRDENNKNHSHNLYSQIQYTNPRTWLINFGARGVYYSSLKSIFIEPRLYIERALGDHFRLKGSAEIKNQSISQIIEFTTSNFGLENQIWTIANQEEENETPILKSKQYTLGSLFSKNNWNVEIEAYYKETNGLTSYTKGFEATNEEFSTGESISKGIDFLIKKKFGKHSTWLGYSLAETQFIFNTLNNGVSFKGNSNITNSFSMSYTYQLKKIEFSLGWKYRTGTPFTPVSNFKIENNEPVVQYGVINSKTLPNYHRLDFSSVYNFYWSKKNTIKGRLGFSILNLYANKNILHRSYPIYQSIDENDNIIYELVESNKLSLNITPNLTLRINF